MRLLIDTVTFIWSIASPHRLSPRALSITEPPTVRLEISSVSLSEIAIKCAKGNLNLPKEKVSAALEGMRLEVLPYTAKHALAFFDLPPHHADPFDRMIISQALAE